MKSNRKAPKLLDCDYYRFKELDAGAVNSYQNEYMSQYYWADFMFDDQKTSRNCPGGLFYKKNLCSIHINPAESLCIIPP